MKHPILALIALTLALGLCLCAAAEEADVVETEEWCATEEAVAYDYPETAVQDVADYPVSAEAAVTYNYPVSEEEVNRKPVNPGDVGYCDGYQYTLREDGGAEVTDYYGPGGEILIPNELDGHPIMDIRGLIFGNIAYRGTPFTVSVYQDHPYLATINGVLFGKSDRKLICCPPSLGLTEYAIPQGIREIGDYAFAYCPDLTSVTIPDSVTAIGGGAFGECTGLTSVTIPDSVTSIGEAAFYGCTGLTSVTIPNSVTAIGLGAFGECTGLTSVTIPDSVTSIGEAAFYGCTGLTSVTIPNSVTDIGAAAFYRCESLTSVTIPDSVTAIGMGAFASCTSLTRIDVRNNPMYAEIDGVLFNKVDKAVICYPAGRTTEAYEIPQGIRSVGDAAFYECTALTSVIIPDSVTAIGYSAFYGCTGLTSVTIPDSVTSIGDQAFVDCTGLTSVTIPDSVTDIGDWAFIGCPNLTATVNEGSYAEAWCINWGIPCTYIPRSTEDAPTDWLND